LFFHLCCSNTFFCFCFLFAMCRLSIKLLIFHFYACALLCSYNFGATIGAPIITFKHMH
jgi:hypothetical protein